MCKLRQVINPHSHSDASIDGAATIKQIVKRNKALGATHVASSEHGNINSAMDLYLACKGEGVKPIIGIEVYLESPFKDFLAEKCRRDNAHMEAAKLEAKVERTVREAYVHLTIHFKDEEAYRYFCSITPKMEERAIVRWGERKPMMTMEELRAIAGHITIGSGCLVGGVQKWLLPNINRPDLAERFYDELRELAGPENFYVELFPHRVTHDWKKPEKDEQGRIVKPGEFVLHECNDFLPDGDYQRRANQWVLDKARRTGDPVIISLDSHFATPNQKLIQDAKIGNGQENWIFHNSYYVMTTEEAAECLKATLDVTDAEIEQFVENSYRWASMFDNFKIPTSKERWVLEPAPPDYMKRVKVAIDRYGRMNWNDQAMVERLKKEIDILAHNGTINLLSYFFTIEEVAEYCKENNILMNVRGSAGGSLLLYLMGISAVNPLKHNLSFERFLTLGRIKANTLPDVDMDIATGGRDQVIAHLERKYGDRFCRISTDALLKLKSSIKDAERSILGQVRPDTEKLTRSLPLEPQGQDSKEYVFGYTDKEGVHHAGILDSHPGLKAYADANPQIWATVTEMLGIQRQKGVHACGCVIADKPVQEYCPIIYVNKSRATGFSPKSIEAAGLVKFDFLGLNTLRDIQNARLSIKERTGEDIYGKWAQDDQSNDQTLYQELWKGNTISIFQFDTDTVRPYLMKIKPTSIEDLAAITSLCRPGCLDAIDIDGQRTLADVYVARCSGEPIKYVHDDLASILEITKGIALYQEQSMEIFKKLAGYSDEQAETVRRGIGKKDKKVLESCMGDLRRGCLARGWTEDQIKLLIEQIMASARYSFNKSHAIAYAYNAFACLWLRERYPLDWWKSVLSNASKDELAVKFWKHVKHFTELPDVNAASDSYVIKGDKLIAPLSIMNGMGEKAYAQVVANAPYASLDQFVRIHLGKQAPGKRSAVHSGIARKLASAGVLDSLMPAKDLTVQEKLSLVEVSAALAKGKKKPEPLPPEFQHITSFGQYLLKKQLISVYSTDLRPIAMKNRGATIDERGVWRLQKREGQEKGTMILDGREVMILKDKINQKQGPNDLLYSCIAYVTQEKIIEYKGKTKRATKMFLDVNGTFYEEVFWPPYGESTAPSGFEDLPVCVIYRAQKDRLSIVHVEPLIPKEKVGDYSVT
jgi:DNA polymerase-3 subunit alpha